MCHRTDGSPSPFDLLDEALESRMTRQRPKLRVDIQVRHRVRAIGVCPLESRQCGWDLTHRMVDFRELI